MKTKVKELTWEETKAKDVGTILYDEFNEGVRFIVMRGPSALCAYVGIPTAHPLAGFGYDLLPIECHGGLTFADKGGDSWPKDYYWYGWDYSHAGDYCFYSSDIISDEKKWLIKDVIDDSSSAIYDFKALIKLAEGIFNKEAK